MNVFAPATGGGASDIGAGGIIGGGGGGGIGAQAAIASTEQRARTRFIGFLR
jgi:hypothetical protein